MPEDWSLVGQLYREALERNPSERNSFLVNACAGNHSLQIELESLLAAGRDAGDFLEADAAGDFVESLLDQSLSLEGKKLHNYELLSLLGTGGMGEVYRALDTRLKREVAVKILPLIFAGDVDRLRRFEQEATAASRLNHPNIVTIYETGDAEYGRFLAMELVEGTTLRHVIARRPQLDIVIRICLQIAQALRVAHAANIVHRDIKPENLMLRPDGYVKILDFGLARLLPPSALLPPRAPPEGAEHESASAITESGMLVGTARYMSPEQAERKHVTSASDIFSFGLVMYELTTGQHPFQAETAFGTLDAIISGAALPPMRINPAIPAALDQLILRMLDKQAQLRPLAADVEQSLSQLAGKTIPDLPHASLHSLKRPVGRTRELEQLNAFWDAAAAGHGLLCCVSGEPGIGKTTLVEDFLSGLAATGRTCMVARGRCSERLAGTEAYSPFLDALDGMQAGPASVAEAMKRLAPTWYSQVARGVPGEAAPERLPAENACSQERVKRELGSLLGELSRWQTLVLFLEDLHWADLSSVDLLAFLAARMANLRLLLVITYRSSDLLLVKHPLIKLKQDLQARGIAHEIKLDFLNRAEVEQYVGLEFPQNRLPSAIAEMIYAKTEGSPLFMTAVLRYLRDRKIVVDNGGCWELARPLPAIERDLPESMQAMIDRMIDRIDEHDRPLLLAASVQGHEFDSAVVARALGKDETDVEERLQRLEQVHQFARLIEEREFPNKTLTLRYRFTHVLYQNALYATLQPARRMALSNGVAEALVSLYGEQSGVVALDLARLFEAGRKFMPAAEHYLIAATNANRIFAASEATALARQGLEVIEGAPQTLKRYEVELSLQLVLGNALLVLLGYGSPEVEELYGRIHGPCREVGQPAQLLSIIYGLWVTNLVHGELERALELGRDFLDLAEQLRSPAVMVGQRLTACPHFYLGQLTQALPYFQGAISNYDPAQHRALAWLYGQEPGMTARSYLCWTFWLLGYPEQAADHNRESLKLARQVEHALSRGHGLFFAGMYAYLCRDWPALRKLANELVAFGEERNVAFWLPSGRVLCGLMLIKEGKNEGAIEGMRSGIADLIAAKNKLCLTILYRVLAEAYAHLLCPADGLSAIQAALDLIEGTGESFFKPELHRFQGELLLQQGARGAASEAEGCFLQALDLARQQSAKSWELRTATSLGRLWAKQGKETEAFELLSPLCLWFTEGADTADIKDARALLGQLR